MKHPQVDMISFTGSTRAGKRIMELAASQVKKIALAGDDHGAKSSTAVQLLSPEGERLSHPEYDISLTDAEARSLYRDLVLGSIDDRCFTRTW